jgi:hypothetical protein
MSSLWFRFPIFFSAKVGQMDLSTAICIFVHCLVAILTGMRLRVKEWLCVFCSASGCLVLLGLAFDFADACSDSFSPSPMLARADACLAFGVCGLGSSYFTSLFVLDSLLESAAWGARYFSLTLLSTTRVIDEHYGTAYGCQVSILFSWSLKSRYRLSLFGAFCW